MAERSLADEIITIVKSEANNNPAPERCNIKRVYPDKVHVDIETNRGSLKYVDVIGYNPRLGDNAIIIYLKEDYSEYVVVADTEGSGSSVDIVTSWEQTLSDEKVPSEKLVKNSLDTKQETLVSGTNIKTINNTSILGSGNITIQGGGGGSVIGTGSFSIDSNGHLIVELPDAVDNPYYINASGHLIYDTSNTHNGE